MARHFTPLVVCSLLIGVLLAAHGASAATWAIPATIRQTEWVTAAPMLMAKDDFGVAVVDGRIYAIGGMTGPLATPLADSEVFDPAANRWEELPPLPTARRAVRAAAVASTIYVVGGAAANSDIVATVDAFDTVAWAWSARAPLPVPLQSVGLIAVGETLLAMGGFTGEGTVADTVFAYDTRADQWSERATMPTARSDLAIAALGGTVYAMGGSSIRAGQAPFTSADVNGPLSVVELYDPAADLWATAPSLPEPMMNFGAVAIDDTLHVLLHEAHYVYSPVSDRWLTAPPMFTPRHGFGIAALGDDLYVIGGCHTDLYDTRETEVLRWRPRASLVAGPLSRGPWLLAASLGALPIIARFLVPKRASHRGGS